MNRSCVTCGEFKPLTVEFFGGHANSPQGFLIECKICREQKRLAKYTHLTQRRCRTCGVDKPITEFGTNARGVPRLQCKRCRYHIPTKLHCLRCRRLFPRAKITRSLCPACRKRLVQTEQARQARRRCPLCGAAVKRASMLCQTCRHDKSRVRKYNLTTQQYQKMLEDCQGRCMICGRNGGRALYIDHDHQTGKVRGLLCNACNSLMGLARDNPLILESAKSYLTVTQD